MMAGKPSWSLQCCSPSTNLTSDTGCPNVELMSWMIHKGCYVCHFCCMLPGASAWLQHGVDCMAWRTALTVFNCPVALLEACLVLQQGVAKDLCT